MIFGSAMGAPMRTLARWSMRWPQKQAVRIESRKRSWLSVVSSTPPNRMPGRQPCCKLKKSLGTFAYIGCGNADFCKSSRLQGLGVDYEARQALLGHRMPGMTATYSLDQAFRLSYGLSYERKAVAAARMHVPDFSGEPPGTRTQGPRLKSSNRPFLASARYCVWFPQLPLVSKR